MNYTKKLIEYVENSGWVKIERKRKDVAVYQKKVITDGGENMYQINIPLEKELLDYQESMKEAILTIIKVENCTELELYQNVMNIEEIIKETKEKAKIQTSLEIAVRLYKNRLFTPAYISGVTNLNMFDIETLIGIVDSGRCCENDLKILTDNIYEIELKKCNKNSENNKAETEEDQLNLIDPKKLIENIENIGWIPFGIRRKNDTTLLYKRKNQPITKMDSLVTIPIDKDLWNYKQLLKVAVLQIARTENCTMMEVVKSIINFRERGGNKRIEDYNTGLRISCHPETVDIGGIINGLFGLSGKVGKLTNMIQKWIFQGDSLDISYTQKELGNILSYIDLISKSLGWSLDELMQKDSTDLKKRQENDETLEFDDSQEEQKSSDLTFASLKEYSEKVTKEAEERLGKSAMRDSVSYTYKK